MDNRGIYSMITTFFLVAAIVFIVIGLVYFNYFTTSQEGAIFEGVEVYEKANDVKDSILRCYGDLDFDKVSDQSLAMACSSRFLEGDEPLVNGFSMEVLDFLGCAPAYTELGEIEECGNRFVYYLDVDENYTSCLGKMVVCS